MNADRANDLAGNVRKPASGTSSRMSRHIPLAAAALHALLVTRPSSKVMHLYCGRTTPTGRFVPRSGSPLCAAHTRQLTVLIRDGATVDTLGRRLCAHCSERLFALARRSEQPVSREDAVAFYRGITLADLVVAVALAETVDDTHAVGFVLGLLHGHAGPVRPAEPVWDAERGAWFVERRNQPRQYLSPVEHDQHIYKRAVFDVHAELVRRRDQLRNAARTPEEVEAAAAKREADDAREARVAAARKTADRMNRVLDRRLNDQYLTPYERELLNSA